MSISSWFLYSAFFSSSITDFQETTIFILFSWVAFCRYKDTSSDVQTLWTYRTFIVCFVVGARIYLLDIKTDRFSIKVQKSVGPNAILEDFIVRMFGWQSRWTRVKKIIESTLLLSEDRKIVFVFSIKSMIAFSKGFLEFWNHWCGSFWSHRLTLTSIANSI